MCACVVGAQMCVCVVGGSDVCVCSRGLRCVRV